MRLIAKILLPLVILGLFAWPAAPARAGVELGYLWALNFDFEQSFDGILTVRVGPWENGNLVSTDAISSAVVPCKRVGPVFLNGGDAVFAGGHLVCELDLAGVLLRNHGLVVDEVDSYGSIYLTTDLETTAQNLAPIVSHPDATYTIDFTQTWAVTMGQRLENTLGPQGVFLGGVTGVVRNKYTFEYECVWMGACQSTFIAGTQGDVTPPGGDRVRFRTEPTRLRIGGDGAATFSGRMGSLLIDPGNSVH